MVLNLEGDDGSEGIVGSVEKMVLLLSLKPESLHSVIWPSLAAPRVNILLMITVYVY